MTVEIDLVEALRCAIYRQEMSGELEGDITDDVMHEAADEIERLRAENAALTKALQRIDAKLDAIIAQHVPDWPRTMEAKSDEPTA